MNSVKTTVIGGVIFLIPMIFLAMVLGHAFQIALKVAKPISRVVPVDSFAGVAVANILAVLLIALVSFLAGLLARSAGVSRKMARLETFLVEVFPVYQSTKRSIADAVQNSAQEDNWKVVLVGSEDGQRFLGYEIEVLEAGLSVVFQPLTPNTKTGFVWTVPQAQLRYLDLNPRDVAKRLRSYGIGLSALEMEAAARRDGPA